LPSIVFSRSVADETDQAAKSQANPHGTTFDLVVRSFIVRPSHSVVP
jgi:hypothetical protein